MAPTHTHTHTLAVPRSPSVTVNTPSVATWQGFSRVGASRLLASAVRTSWRSIYAIYVYTPYARQACHPQLSHAITSTQAALCCAALRCAALRCAALCCAVLVYLSNIVCSRMTACSADSMVYTRCLVLGVWLPMVYHMAHTAPLPRALQITAFTLAGICVLYLPPRAASPPSSLALCCCRESPLWD